MHNLIRIGTRTSELAVWQARYVERRLTKFDSSLQIQIVPISTEADRRQNVSLSKFGGKGLFIKELEYALAKRRIDIAVHSMKDVSVTIDSQFAIPVILKRANPYDAFVSNQYDRVSALPQNSKVGTCSLRRRSQLLNVRPDLQIVHLRGNVPTRLEKLDANNFEATLLAVAGLTRLGYEDRISEILRGDNHIPSPGQGALGIECRSDDLLTHELIAPLNHEKSRIAVESERSVNRTLGGSCHVPIGIHAVIDNGQLTICGSVGSPDGTEVVRSYITGHKGQAEKLAAELACELIRLGAKEILSEFG